MMSQHQIAPETHRENSEIGTNVAMELLCRISNFSNTDKKAKTKHSTHKLLKKEAASTGKIH